MFRSLSENYVFLSEDTNQNEKECEDYLFENKEWLCKNDKVSNSELPKLIIDVVKIGEIRLFYRQFSLPKPRYSLLHSEFM